ncbi:response regulator [Prolixibacteraceae bacterium Z1-6]|uniref:histidine kinase n=1 Tax=Draconibacterium aestuarii TaxID=2998507 RepID=A0A9X3F1R5_9BACT|nr:response regulator [Prolixibacteraceae bacterium Z1-6]
MSFQYINDGFDNWLEKQISSPEDTIDELALKKRFFFFIAPSFPLLFGTTIFFWNIGLHQLAVAMSIFIIFELIVTLLFFILHRNINLVALINQYFYVLFSFSGVIYFGGILNSGGVVFIGLAGALNSLSFLKPIQIRNIFIVYIATLLIGALLQPWLTPVPEITPTVNLILFVIHLLVVASVFYSRLHVYIQESIQAKKMEAEHLKELDKIKTNFYTNITHEFRTPLTVILGLTDPETKVSGTTFQKNIPMIRKNALRLLQLVNQMLDLAKLEAQTMQLHFIQTDIITYFHQLVEPFKHLANEKKTELLIESKLKQLTMDFDPERMDSLLGNLFMNAIKYSPENSRITFEVSELTEKINPEDLGYSLFSNRKFQSDRLLRLRIEDTGMGITPEEIPLIFNRFYRITTNRLQHHEGAGIGLLLVKEIINLLQGNLFIQSTPGAGTKVVVLLPITNNAPIAGLPKIAGTLTEGENYQPELKAAEPKSGKELPQLLLIEDNDDVVTYLKTVTGPHYNVHRAKNGNEGIEMAFNGVPDIIISDIVMPGKDGYEVCHTLKQDFRTSHIPIILLTAKSDKTSQIEGFEHGADAYVTKPFHPRELLVRLQKLIEIRDRLKAKYKSLAVVSDIQQEKSPGPDEQFLFNTKQILEKRFNDDAFDPLELSRQLGISRSQLFRKIKALTGLSASHFICFYRIYVAKEKLQKTNLTISEIAYEVGFKDPAYFTRVFTREFGFSPKVMRQKHHN